MNFANLSPTAVALLAELAQVRDVWLDRSGKVIAVLRKLAGCNEPAIIPPIAGFLFDKDHAVVQATDEVLQSLFCHAGAERLPALDESMRAQGRYGYAFAGDTRWNLMVTGQVQSLIRPDPERCALLLGLATCHASGYVRRNAVACLDQQVQSGAEIPFLLLRLGDWVHPVRLQAQCAVARRLDAEHASTFLPYLGLVERLRARRRMTESPLLSRIEEVLQTNPESLLNASFTASGRLARRYGLTLAWRAVANTGAMSARESIIERTLRDTKDQALRLQIVHWLVAKDADPVLQQRFMRDLLADKLPAARRLALGWCMVHEPTLHQDELHAALLDRSRTVRAIAQFYLSKSAALDVPGFYREAVMRGQPGNLPAAFDGLGETGKAEDAKLLTATLYAPRVAVRKAALAALGKLVGCAGEYLPVFVDALQDAGSPGVSRQARLVLERCVREVGSERLSAVFFGSPHLHVRRQALALINRLPKWQRVTLLVEIMGRAKPEDGITRMADNFLRDWISGYNRNHEVLPSKLELAHLAAALAQYRAGMDARLWQNLQGHVSFMS